MPKIPPIVSLARAGDKDAVLKLVEGGADVNEQDMFGFTALMCMASQGEYEMCVKLVDAGADVNLCPTHGPCKGMTAQDIADAEQTKIVGREEDPGNGYCLIIRLLEPEDAIPDEEIGLD